jgi:XRE family aerobic/anaerobic benzoate catabolism transcriptional regulator
VAHSARRILRRMEGRSQLLANLGKRLREARTKRGMSQEVLAELAGLNRNYVNQVECGRRNVSIVNLVKIAEAMDVELATLIRGISNR